jgi:hypothetical protein
MRNKIKVFWMNLLQNINNRINQWLNKNKETLPVTDAGDDSVVNFLAMILRKVINRTLMGAEFSVVSDSTQAEPLIDLCDDLQEHMQGVAGQMLGNSIHAECWVVPSFITVGGEQKLVHSYISGDRVCITQTKEDGQIAECYMIINAVERNDRTFFLCRKHNLDDNGNLVISYFVADDKAKEVNADIPEWDTLKNTEVTYASVNNIGFGRYKSPVNAFGTDTVYGVPLNHGCGLIEAQLRNAVEYIEKEMKASKKMLFPDWSIVRQTDKDGKPVGMYSIDDHIFPIRKAAGTNGSLIDEYSPAIRGTEYEEHLTSLLERYQALMGVTEIITHNGTTKGATATEVKVLNTDNISLEQSIKRAIKRGNIETLEADAMYLGIARDLWEYDEEYADIYVDEQQMLKNYIDLYNIGAVELRDVVKYWFPTYSEEQIDEKVAKMEEAKTNNAQKSIEELLNV